MSTRDPGEAGPLRTLVASAAAGLGAGAAGTTALNAVAYLDMVVRGRAASSTPEQVIEEFARRLGVTVPGGPGTAPNRVAGLGALAGIAAGLGTGLLTGLGVAAARRSGHAPSPVVTGLAATLVVLLGTNGPMTALGVTDPRTWSVPDWVSDVVPHAAYGAVAAAVTHALTAGGAGARQSTVRTLPAT